MQTKQELKVNKGVSTFGIMLLVISIFLCFIILPLGVVMVFVSLGIINGGHKEEQITKQRLESEKTNQILQNMYNVQQYDSNIQQRTINIDASKRPYYTEEQIKNMSYEEKLIAEALIRDWNDTIKLNRRISK